MSRPGSSALAISRAARSRSIAASGRETAVLNSAREGSALIAAGRRDRSTPRGVRNPGGPQGEGLELLGQLQGPRRGAARRLLGLRGGREAQQEPPAQFVVVPLVLLDHVAVEGGRSVVACALAELDELPVLHH